MRAKIISIETRRCCDCGKPLSKESQFLINDKQVACSNCWTIRARSN
jgi:recombinational DNA repair protein (RecF pathway)